MRSVFIHSTGSYLPGPPVDNDSIEEHLGLIGGKASPFKKIVLAKNGIKTRHYALEKGARVAALAAEAVRATAPPNCDFLAAASSQPDLLLPGLAGQVQAELQWPTTEIMSFAGVCSSGIMALKAAYWAVASGEREHAVACAAELPSRFFRASYLEPLLESTPQGVPSDVEFLRWMLSDGAGACYLTSRPTPGKRALRIDWIDAKSYAGQYPTCMYAGALKKSSGEDIDSVWADYKDPAEAARQGLFTLRQDLDLLKHIVPLGMRRLIELIDEGRVSLADTHWLLFHFSSMKFFRDTARSFATHGLTVPEERWFTNLPTAGNTGSASFFVMLDELLRSGRLRSGQRILGMVPESGRFNICFLQLTCV